MKLDKDFSLENDSNNWDLVKHQDTGETNDKGEKIISKDKWYYSTIKQALTRYTSEALKPCKDSQAMLTKLDEIDELINSLKVK